MDADYYQPFVGILDDGSEVLVSVHLVDVWDPTELQYVKAAGTVEVAFRSKPHHTWGPPTNCEKR